MGSIRFFLHRLKLRTVWSWAGIRATWETEHSFRTWVWANAVSALAAFLLPLPGSDRALILALGLLILAAELLNTAIEEAVDYISEDDHPRAKRAKDAGSAGVAVAGVAAGVAWVVALFGLM